MSPTVCLYHDDKPHFDQVTKELMKAKWIPRPRVNRLAMAVCSCRKKLKDDIKLSKDELCKITEYFQKCLAPANVCQNPERWPGVLHRFIQELLNLGVDPNYYSGCRFLYILHQAVEHKNYDILEKEGRQLNFNSSGELSTKETGETKGKQRLTAKGFQCMLNKRMRKATRNKKKFMITVPIFPGLIKSLETKSGLQLCKKSVNGSFAIQPAFDVNNKHYADRVNTTAFYVWANDKKEAADIWWTLHSVAEPLQKEHDRDWERELRLRKDRKRLRAQMYSSSFLDAEGEEEILEFNLDERKRLNGCAHMNNIKEKRGRGQKMATPSPLAGGACVNCLKPFEGFRSESSLAYQPCHHHSGYLRPVYVWNCCNARSLDKEATSEDHISQGCCTDDTHQFKSPKMMYMMRKSQMKKNNRVRPKKRKYKRRR